MVDARLVTRRFLEWSNLPIREEKEHQKEDVEKRQRAWSLYCDARDGHPDGTTAHRDAIRKSRSIYVLPQFTPQSEDPNPGGNAA